MRKDWEVKKWSEVLSIINGKNQKKVEDNNGAYPIYGSGGVMGYASDYLCPGNSVIIGRKGNINKPLFVKEKFWNVDTAFGLISKEGILDSKYLFYFCVNYNFEKLNKAVTIPSLTKTDLLNIRIDLPSLQTQQQVVEEFDCLISIIEKQKKQLEELDNLAQSIFYDMFGSIHNNKKSLDINNLNDLCEFIKDGTHNTPQYTDDKVNGVKFLSAKDVVEGCINWENIKYIPYELHAELHKRIAPQRDDILLCKNGTTGIAAIVDTDDVFDIYVSLALLRFKKPYNAIYVLYAINNPYTKEQFNSSLKGVGVPNLHLGEIKKARILWAPLSLQQEFASKIEAIEKQKKLIKKSIKETEDLFNSRMDYYFN